MYFLNLVFGDVRVGRGSGILPIRLVGTSSGERGLGALSRPLSGRIQYDYKQTNVS
jgi:hypothetical protein